MSRALKTYNTQHAGEHRESAPPRATLGVSPSSLSVTFPPRKGEDLPQQRGSVARLPALRAPGPAACIFSQGKRLLPGQLVALGGAACVCRAFPWSHGLVDGLRMSVLPRSACPCRRTAAPLSARGREIGSVGPHPPGEFCIL